MYSKRKISKFDKQIKEICEKFGHELHGNLSDAANGDGKWSLVVRNTDKTVFVKLVVPYRFSNSSVLFSSNELVHMNAHLLGFKGPLGSWSGFPLSKTSDLKVPDSAFGYDCKNAQKVFLVYPKCQRLCVRSEKGYENFRPGMQYCGFRIHDGASFRYLLENFHEKRKFADFGE